MFIRKIFIVIFILYFGIALSQSTIQSYIYVPNNFVEIVKDTCKKILPLGYEINPIKANNNKWYIPASVLDTVYHYGYKISRPVLNHLTIVQLDNSMFEQPIP